MYSFYSTETLFSANHFTQTQAWFTVGGPVPLGHGYEPVQFAPVASSIGKNEPRHTVSKPPQHKQQAVRLPALVACVQATTSVESIRINSRTKVTYAEPIQPITPTFLLEGIPERHPKADSPVRAPPKMERHLSDPSFLLGNGPKEPTPEPVVPAKQQPILIEVWDREKDGAWWEKPAEKARDARSGSIESAFSSESLGSKISSESNSTTKQTSGSRRIQRKIKEKAPRKELAWGTVSRKKKRKKSIECGNTYKTKIKCRVAQGLDPRKSREIWTMKAGTFIEVREIDYETKRAYIYAECKYFSKYYGGPQTKFVEGWMSYKNKMGWVLWL